MKEDKLCLVSPATEWEQEYRAMVAEATTSDPNYALTPASLDFSSLLESLGKQERGEELPPGFVPQSTFWLVRSDGRLLGECRLRHRLTEALRRFGGHIGYTIRPSERQKGYGKRILALALEKAGERGIEKVLVTCNEANLASAKIIEANGGVLEGYDESLLSGRRTCLYWIELSRPTSA